MEDLTSDPPPEERIVVATYYRDFLVDILRQRFPTKRITNLVEPLKDVIAESGVGFGAVILENQLMDEWARKEQQRLAGAVAPIYYVDQALPLHNLVEGIARNGYTGIILGCENLASLSEAVGAVAEMHRTVDVRFSVFDSAVRGILRLTWSVTKRT
jgi:hypothetical protein